MHERVLSVEQARTRYLKSIIAMRQPGTGSEQLQASRELKRSVTALQSAQRRKRLQDIRRRHVVRPSDWNLEVH